MKKNKDKKEERGELFPDTPCCVPQNGSPENCSECVNFFGTYNIQQTANTPNTYPAIAQGIEESEAEKLKKESERWQKEDKKDK